jgi:hypothetical protein
MVIGFSLCSVDLLYGLSITADRRRAAGGLQSVIVSFPMLPVAGQGSMYMYLYMGRQADHFIKGRVSRVSPDIWK